MLGHKIISESLEMLSALQTRVFRHVQAFKSLHDKNVYFKISGESFAILGVFFDSNLVWDAD